MKNHEKPPDLSYKNHKSMFNASLLISMNCIHSIPFLNEMEFVVSNHQKESLAENQGLPGRGALDPWLNQGVYHTVNLHGSNLPTHPSPEFG